MIILSQTCKKRAQSKNCYKTINTFMWKTHAHARVHIQQSHDFRTFDSYPSYPRCVFSVKNTNKPKQHRHAPNNDAFCAEPRGLKRPSVWCDETDERNSEMEDRSSHMEGVRVAIIITQRCCISFHSCLTAPHHQIHCHCYITDAFKVFLRYTIEALDHFCCCHL